MNGADLSNATLLKRSTRRTEPDFTGSDGKVTVSEMAFVFRSEALKSCPGRV
jgi:hypothetical protein